MPTGSDDVHSCSDAKPTVSLNVKDNHDGSYDVSADVTAGKFPLQQLQFFFDDQIISTQQISADGTYSTTYSPTSTGSHSFKAQVTDQGYYQADDSQTVNVTQAGGGGGGTVQAQSPTGIVSHKNVKFRWTGDGSASYTLTIQGSGPNQTYTVSGTSYTTDVPIGAHTWTVTSSNGHSDSASFVAN